MRVETDAYLFNYKEAIVKEACTMACAGGKILHGNTGKKEVEIADCTCCGACHISDLQAGRM